MVFDARGLRHVDELLLELEQLLRRECGAWSPRFVYVADIAYYLIFFIQYT